MNFKTNRNQSLKINRRKFIGTAAATVIFPGLLLENQACVQNSGNPSQFTESAREIPVKDEVDIFEGARNSGNKIEAKPYEIPLRALIAKDVEGLMMAGRCISSDFIAHSSYRVTGNAVAMGEVTGAVAAVASQRGEMPHQVSWKEAVKKLKKYRAEVIKKLIKTQL